MSPKVFFRSSNIDTPQLEKSCFPDRFVDKAVFTIGVFFWNNLQIQGFLAALRELDTMYVFSSLFPKELCLVNLCFLLLRENEAECVARSVGLSLIHI